MSYTKCILRAPRATEAGYADTHWALPTNGNPLVVGTVYARLACSQHIAEYQPYLGKTNERCVAYYYKTETIG